MTHPTLEERVENIHQRFLAKNDGAKASDPTKHTLMALSILDIVEYDHNPRRERNAAYERIQASIRQRGFTGVLPITRRPGDTLYMVAEGGNTVLHILKELYAETQDPRYARIQCLLEPWVSESEILIAHLVENDARGDLVFIDRAQAVHDLWSLLEHETGQRLSTRALASALRQRGYSLDPTTISRINYAVEALLPVIPRALRSGLGRPAIDRLRKLENQLIEFLKHRGKDEHIIAQSRQGFLQCLAKHDNEEWLFEPIEHAIIDHLAEICGEDRYQVIADLDALAQSEPPGQEAPPRVSAPARPSHSRAEATSTPMRGKDRPATVTPTKSNDTASGFTVLEDEVLPEAEALPKAPVTPQTTVTEPGSTTPPGSRELTRFDRPELPQDIKSLRARFCTIATQLARRNGLGEYILPCGNRGCGFLLDLPLDPLYADTAPETAAEAKQVALWWLLSALSEQWPYKPLPEAAPSLAYLPEESRLYPAIAALLEGDEATAIAIVTPIVSHPPSLDVAARQLFAVLDETEFELFIGMINTRRALQAHCRRLGKRTVWEV